MIDTTLRLEEVTPQLSFAIAEGKVWLNEQRIMLFSQTALGKFRSEVYRTIGHDRAKAFFLRLGFQLGVLDGELARKSTDGDFNQRFLIGPKLHALRGMALPELKDLVIAEDGSQFHCEVEWHNSYEVDIYKTELPGFKEPGCWTLVGYASGYSSNFLRRVIYFKETECLTAGHDRCFAIGKFVEDWEDGDELRRYFDPAPLITELQELRDEVEQLRGNSNERDRFTDIVGESKPFRAALEMVTKASDSNVSVLLLGETGVGKEVMARALHRSSDRANKPFVAVNCAAIPSELIEAELFGVAKGAYTGAVQSREGKFERADGGTIFLDEVVELSPRAQATLLRVLQERELERVGDNTIRHIDVRVVAATNEDLSEAVKAGKFRSDLFYRLSAYPVRIPALRERSEDIPLFVDYFLERHAEKHGKRVQTVSDRGMHMLRTYDWPGNIRELENVIERAVILADPDSSISMDLILGPYLEESSSDHTVGQGGELVPALEQRRVATVNDLADYLIEQGIPLEEMEEALFDRAMEKANGKVSEAARSVGMTRPAFAYRINKKAGKKSGDKTT